MARSAHRASGAPLPSAALRALWGGLFDGEASERIRLRELEAGARADGAIRTEAPGCLDRPAAEAGRRADRIPKRVAAPAALLTAIDTQPEAWGHVLAVVETELRELAARILNGGAGTLEPTGLIQDAWERLRRREAFESGQDRLADAAARRRAGLRGKR